MNSPGTNKVIRISSIAVLALSVLCAFTVRHFSSEDPDTGKHSPSGQLSDIGDGSAETDSALSFAAYDGENALFSSENGSSFVESYDKDGSFPRDDSAFEEVKKESERYEKQTRIAASIAALAKEEGGCSISENGFSIDETALSSLSDDEFSALDEAFSSDCAPRNTDSFRKLFYGITGYTPLSYIELFIDADSPHYVGRSTADAENAKDAENLSAEKATGASAEKGADTSDAKESDTSDIKPAFFSDIKAADNSEAEHEAVSDANNTGESSIFTYSSGMEKSSVSLVFAGDLNFADDWYNMSAYRSLGCDITNNITGELLDILRDADICMMNCEFSISDRGSPLCGKLYTFRAAPQNADFFNSVGCDIVSLANNHVFDYGEDAFFDTMSNLYEYGIPHVGAGHDLEEAMEYRSFIAGGFKIGFVAASNAENYRLTPGADVNERGILLMYDPENVLSAIDRAVSECDFTVVYVHWGTENSTAVNENQRSLRDLFIDHGAGMIVGAHPHVLQEDEMFRGVPVIYSLGNFWFNMETLDTAVCRAEIYFDGDKIAADYEMIPCVQSGGVTRIRK